MTEQKPSITSVRSEAKLPTKLVLEIQDSKAIHLFPQKSKLVGSLLTSKSKDSAYSKSNPNNQITGSIRKIIPSAPGLQDLKTQSSHDQDQRQNHFNLTSSSYFKKNSSTSLQQGLLQPLKVINETQRIETPLKIDSDFNNATKNFMLFPKGNQASISSPMLQSFSNNHVQRLRPLTNSQLSEQKLITLDSGQSQKAQRSYSRPTLQQNTVTDQQQAMLNLKMRSHQPSLDRNFKTNEQKSHNNELKDNFEILPTHKEGSLYQTTSNFNLNKVKLNLPNYESNLVIKKNLQQMRKKMDQNQISDGPSEITDYFQTRQNVLKPAFSSKRFILPSSYETKKFIQVSDKVKIEEAPYKIEKKHPTTTNQSLTKSQSVQNLPSRDNHADQNHNDNLPTPVHETRELSKFDKMLKTLNQKHTQHGSHQFEKKQHHQEKTLRDQSEEQESKFDNQKSAFLSSYYNKQQQEKGIQVLKYSAISKAGRNVRLQTKTNQDSYSVIKGFCGSQTNWYFGVFDGHGFYGHLASDFASRQLSLRLSQLVQGKNQLSQPPTPSQARDHSKTKDIAQAQLVDIASVDEQNLKEMITQSYIWTNEQMGCQGFDVAYSGTTAVSTIVLKECFITSNAGDSRTIIYRQSQGSNLWEAESLSRDHKPNLAGESERIISRNGRIDSFKDSSGNNIGPMRVWMKHEDIPGLAMSRSLGDMVAESLGVIPSPDIKISKRQFEKDRALVICSDGVTEFLTNEQIGDIIQPYYLSNDTEAACRKLIEESTQTWLKEESVIDDITAIVIFFH